MHIVVVTTSYPSAPGDAAGHFVKAEVDLLLGAGHAVTVVAPLVAHTSPNPNAEQDLTAERRAQAAAASRETLVWLPAGDLFGAPGAAERVKVAPWRLRHFPLFWIKVNRVLRGLQYDRLIAHWLLPTAFPICFFGEPRSRPVPFPSEIVVHGSDARLLSLLPRTLSRFILAQWVKQGVNFRCVSGELRDMLTAIYAPILPHIEVAACAISVPALPTRAELRQQLSLGADEFIMVCAARLVANKRVDLALKVALGAPSAKPKKIIVLGEGPLRGALEQRFPAVVFKGQLSRIDALQHIAAADVLLSASQLEGAPTVIREARALGTEVWSSAVGDVADWAARDPGIHLLPAFG